MQINWFTVIAQIINFLILVWLLKRFLYKPILNAIDERETNIKGQLKEAEDKKAAALQEQEDFNKKNADFDQQKKELLNKAVAEVNVQRDKLFEDAKNEANTLRSNLERSAKENQENTNLATAKTTQMQVFAITRKVLADIASSDLEEQSVNTFNRRLSELNNEEKKKFVEAFKSGSNSILVRSAFELSLQQQKEITASVNKVIEETSQLQFKKSLDLISGIELTTDGYKLAWSFSEYLNSFQNNISETASESL